MIVGRAIARVERDDENHGLTLGQGSLAKYQKPLILVNKVVEGADRCSGS
jgi:hypothetical protein